ncbi:protein phosphatase 2C domain-containing protein [Mucilaginibacter sp. CSA2-8R]|uniref:PP2C family protein-serine/threonine phosphatase n=1 Tax=Mucilaginibacter sp. CSA2-8R TaxID=3141542 RepID=UPI00315D204D
MAENYFGLTDTGRVRDNNEDTFIAQQTPGGLIVACVIDGVGGYHGGEVAAEIARQEVVAQLNRTQGDIITGMTAAFKQASKNIYQRRKEEKELESMACVATLAVVDITSNQFYYAHVGDTRLYLLRDGSLVKITKDHSFVGFLEDSGRLTESAAMNHPKRNEINKALGFDTAIATDESYIETGQSPFLPGDALLLCSDGLTDLVDKEVMTRIVTQPVTLEQKAAQLIDAANRAGGKDNITVVLVQNDKTSQKTVARMPASPVKKKETVNKPDTIISRTNETVTTPQQAPAVADKKSSSWGLVFGLLSLIFLGTTVWFYMQLNAKSNQQATPSDTAAAKQPGAMQVKLQNAINAVKGDTLTLSDTTYKAPILISDSLVIDKDTLFIKTKGNIRLQRDSVYAGPGLILGGACKYLVIEGLQMQDFNTGIALQNTSLELRGVQFINCKQPVNASYLFNNDKRITAKIGRVSYRADSIITVKPNGNK